MSEPPSGGAPILSLRGVKRTYAADVEQPLEVLKGVDLDVRAGEVVGLIGPSGSGKSSLLHAAGLLERPTAGEVRFAGQDCAPMNDRQRTRLRLSSIGFVYQFHQLLPELTARDNVALPLLIAGRPRRAAQDRAGALLERMGLAHRLDHQPGQLSGGEQQRVAIARALANGPRLVLADEPTGNLDPETSGSVFQSLFDLARLEQTAVLIATHNLQLAGYMDRVFALAEGGWPLAEGRRRPAARRDGINPAKDRGSSLRRCLACNADGSRVATPWGMSSCSGSARPQETSQMQIGAASTTSSDILKQLLALSQATAAGQSSPAEGVASAASAETSQQSVPTAPAAKPSSSQDSFSPDTLSALIGSQSATPPAAPSAADVAGQMLEGADTDGSGSLSLDEVQKALTSAGDTTDATTVKSAFQALDTNGDGSLSADELTTGLEQEQATQQTQAGGAGHAHHGHHHHGGGGGGAEPASASDLASSIISATDTNGDGSISLDELTTALTKAQGTSATGTTSSTSAASATTGTSSTSDLQQAFSALDKDGDGKLSAADLTSALQAFLSAQANVSAQGLAANFSAQASTAVSVTA